MTVSELSRAPSFGAVSLPCPDRQINGVYIGDLLSWVMGRAEPDNAWLTIMSNINIIAVATLSDVSCIILTEGVTLADDIIALANEKNINILSTPLASYECAILLGDMIG